MLAAASLQAGEPGDTPVRPPSGPIPTEVLVRVVAYGAMVLGDEVGGARVTITEVETGRLLASGTQQGEPGDQNQIMRTPRLMGEPQYSGQPAGSFRATLELDRPTLVEISAVGPLAFPSASRRASKTVLLIPGKDVGNDGIVLHLNGYIVQIEHPEPGEPLIAKEDVKLRASVRTLSGAPLRPYGDWDSRRTDIFAEIMIGEQVIERVQMFYAGEKSLFEAPFFVPRPSEAPNGLTLRVVAADWTRGNFGMGEARYPVLPEQLRPAKRPER
jgi:hypothetical protein